ncbi:hypothetical protein DPMN_161947 [Dreissena polymorpha]|uniref:Uncharacterized protein n=1 Tax=Dreissena polymorpha TaxID=45954 RepID=A0A9D4IT65_DREPO|nr:hypothetical protein DPMN_161947 [Dreissena polymorpha]
MLTCQFLALKSWTSVALTPEGTTGSAELDQCRSYPCSNNGIFRAGPVSLLPLKEQRDLQSWTSVAPIPAGTTGSAELDQCRSNPCRNNGICRAGPVSLLPL